MNSTRRMQSRTKRWLSVCQVADENMAPTVLWTGRHCWASRALRLAFIFSRRLDRWLLLTSSSLIRSRAERSCREMKNITKKKRRTLINFNTSAHNIFSHDTEKTSLEGPADTDIYVLILMILVLTLTLNSFKMSIWTFETRLSLQFSLLHFQLVFDLLCIFWGRLVSSHLTFQSDHLVRETRKQCHRGQLYIPSCLTVFLGPQSSCFQQL